MSADESEPTALPAVTELPAGLRLIADGKSVVHRAHGDEAFLPVEFPERVWLETNYNLRYHVYTSESERVSVPAASAIDAIAKSGVEKPFKIVRGLASEDTVAEVIQAGRLVPSDQAGTDPDAQGSEADPSADQADADAGPQPDDEASPAQAGAEAEIDANVEPADIESDAAAEATDVADTEEPQTEQETP